MKIFFVLALTSMMCSAVIAQNSHMNDEQSAVLGKVIEKLKNDRVALEHYLLVGKMRCYKALDLGNKKKIDYELNWLRSGMLNFPLISVLKQDAIIDYFDEDIDARINNKKRALSLRGEKFFTSSGDNGVLICESIFRINKENTQEYNKYVTNINNYKSFDIYGIAHDNYEGYLNNIIINNKHW